LVFILTGAGLAWAAGGASKKATFMTDSVIDKELTNA
jgi:hypothetical protein